jgi:hypothetical protein
MLREIGSSRAFIPFGADADDLYLLSSHQQRQRITNGSRCPLAPVPCDYNAAISGGSFPFHGDYKDRPPCTKDHAFDHTLIVGQNAIWLAHDDEVPLADLADEACSKLLMGLLNDAAVHRETCEATRRFNALALGIRLRKAISVDLIDDSMNQRNKAPARNMENRRGEMN